MAQLEGLKNLTIDWDMTPEQAVTLYLEWGNNNWRDTHPPVRSKEDFTNYFVVDTWDGRPRVFLLRRNSEGVEELAALELPRELAERFVKERGFTKGVYEPTEQVKEWLRNQLEN
ncbi:DVU0772 family protein [Thermodesulfobacteriota bacterium]